MALFDRLLGRNQKSFLPSKLWNAIIWGKGWEDYSRWDKRKLIEQAYERNPTFYAACNLIAETVADIPIYVDYKTSTGMGSSTDHPILSLMDRSDDGRKTFVERMMLYLVVTGEAYAQIVFSHSDKRDRRPLGLVTIPAQDINPIQGDYMEPIKGFVFRDTKDIYFDNDEVLYVKQINLREYFHGMSAGVPLAEMIDLNNAAITWNKNIAQAGGMPPIIAKAPGISREESQQLKDDWQMSSGGANNSHRLKVVSENLDLVKLTDKPNEMEWNNALMSTTRMILMGLGVPSELMNDAQNKTYNNQREARKALYMEACIPLARKFYGAMTKKLQPYYSDNPVICIDTDAIGAIQEDRALVVERLTKAVDSGIISRNEAREELGYTVAKEAKTDPMTGQTTEQAVQETALNGAQVEAAVNVLLQVSAGSLSAETAKLILSNFFGIDTAIASEMVNAQTGRTVTPEQLEVQL